MRKGVDVTALYRIETMPHFNLAGIVAWLIGFIVYKLAAPIGATLPALGTSIVVYAALTIWHPPPLASQRASYGETSPERPAAKVGPSHPARGT
jgi:purine-cytosine permease-like protein